MNNIICIIVGGRNQPVSPAQELQVGASVLREEFAYPFSEHSNVSNVNAHPIQQTAGDSQCFLMPKGVPPVYQVTPAGWHPAAQAAWEADRFRSSVD